MRPAASRRVRGRELVMRPRVTPQASAVNRGASLVFARSHESRGVARPGTWEFSLPRGQALGARGVQAVHRVEVIPGMALPVRRPRGAPPTLQNDRTERTMGLSWQQGPLGRNPHGRFLVPGLPARLLYAEPLRRRMR